MTDVTVDPSKGSKAVVPSTPAYAITRCQALGHELREQWDGYERGFNYNNNHQVAVAWENKMRAEYGQVPRSDDTLLTDGRRLIKVGANSILIDTSKSPIAIEYK